MNVFKTIVVHHPMGLQSFVAAELVQLAAQFKSDIVVWKDQLGANGKSLTGLMALAAGQGTRLKFVVDGEDADEAMEAIFRYLKSGTKVNKAPPIKTALL